MARRTPKIKGTEIEVSSDQLETLRGLVAAGVLLRDEEGTPYVRYGEGWAVPALFTYAGTRMTDAGLIRWEIVVQYAAHDGRMRCASIRLDGAEPGASVDGERFPLATIVEESLLWVAREVDDAGHVRGVPLHIRVESLEEARDIHARVQTEHRRRSPGRRRNAQSHEELLDEVARVYRAAVATRQPTKAVYDHFKRLYSRPYVGRLVQEARERGKLEPAPGRGIPGIVKRSSEGGADGS